MLGAIFPVTSTCITVYPDQIIIGLKTGSNLAIDYCFSMRGPYKKLTDAAGSTASESQKQILLKALVQGYAMRKRLLEQPGTSIAEITKADGKDKSHLIRLIHFSLMAPDLAARVLKGDIPAHLTRESLKRDLPISWAEQYKFLNQNN